MASTVATSCVGVGLELLLVFIYYYILWHCSPARAMASSSTRFLAHTQRRTTVGRTPLDEWSACRRDLYLKTHNTHNRQTYMTLPQQLHFRYRHNNVHIIQSTHFNFRIILPQNYNHTKNHLRTARNYSLLYQYNPSANTSSFTHFIYFIFYTFYPQCNIQPL
jgi:hypothetical protein